MQETRAAAAAAPSPADQRPSIPAPDGLRLALDLLRDPLHPQEPAQAAIPSHDLAVRLARASYDSQLEAVRRLPGMLPQLEAAQAFLRRQARKRIRGDPRALQMLEAAIQQGKHAFAAIDACRRAGTRLPTSTWAEQEQLRLLSGLTNHRLQTMRFVRCMIACFPRLANAWVVNLRWRLFSFADPAELQAIRASGLWNWAIPLWFPEVDLQALLAAARAGRYL